MDVIISALTQRTGSTLVQRIFNCRKNTLIWGEHGGIVSEFVRIADLASYFSKISKDEKDDFFQNGKDPNLWTANMTPDEPYIEVAVAQSIKTLFDHMYIQHRHKHDRIGFKEVRYGKSELMLLRKCFPDSAIILVVRNPIDIWRSETAYWADDAEAFGQIWNERAKQYRELEGEMPGTVLIRYEDLVERNVKTLQLLSELALVSLDEIHQVLSVQLNSTRSTRPQDEIDTIMRLCNEGMALFNYEHESF
ncbi:sulfotransferase [Paenibacillus sp. YIM B09110]|uniref:sulfotransferase n=1 Tax=Paenibacillus sp. YIM B09110 TaxID=3126102 RepID=UPI00301D4EE7